MVHIASCVGNVVSRLFIKFECNEGESSSTDYGDGKLADVSSQAKRNPFRCECSWRVCRVRRTDRWSPILARGGLVLLSPKSDVEEVCPVPQVPSLTFSFWCAAVAAMTLKALNPFGNGSLVLVCFARQTES
jgi:chloride channel 3/4/5